MSTIVEETVIAEPEDGIRKDNAISTSIIGKDVVKTLADEHILDHSLDSSAESTLDGDFSAYEQGENGQNKINSNDSDTKGDNEEMSMTTADLYDKTTMETEEKDADAQIEELTGGLPVFANEQCKKLHSENKALEKSLEVLQDNYLEMLL